MSTSAERVREFHQKFDLTVEESPIIPSEKDRILRVQLLLEEALEFATASGVKVYVRDIQIKHVDDLHLIIDQFTCPNIVEVADALADTDYVTQGAALTWGIPLEECSLEVHRSNMSKLWDDGLVHKRGDGKVIKPPTYSPADLEPVLRSHANDIGQ